MDLQKIVHRYLCFITKCLEFDTHNIVKFEMNKILKEHFGPIPLNVKKKCLFLFVYLRIFSVMNVSLKLCG